MSAKGYYLIVAADDKDATTRLALVTTDVKMVEKNTYMGSKKETEETNYKVGDIVTYTATVSIPANAALTVADGDDYKAGHGPIVVHDVMDPVLAFDPDSVVASPEIEFELVTDPDDDCTFEIVFPVTEDLLGEDVTFTYEAELTSAAINPDTGFINKLFAENNGYQTIPDEPEVWTFNFGFKKVFDEEDNTDLTAVFEIRTDADDASTAITFTSAGTNAYVVADSSIAGGVTQIKMTNGTEVDFTGLSEGTYYLVEISTSAGYNLLDAPVEVVITDESEQDEETGEWTIAHSVSVDDEELDEGVYSFEVENHSGTVLPSTGGIGTTIFHVAGVALVLGAGIIFISKRRANG